MPHVKQPKEKPVLTKDAAARLLRIYDIMAHHVDVVRATMGQAEDTIAEFSALSGSPGSIDYEDTILYHVIRGYDLPMEGRAALLLLSDDDCEDPDYPVESFVRGFCYGYYEQTVRVAKMWANEGLTVDEIARRLECDVSRAAEYLCTTDDDLRQMGNRCAQDAPPAWYEAEPDDNDP